MSEGLSSMPPVAEVYDDHAVVCPHCRHRHGDADEYFLSKDFAEIECAGEGCGRTFFAERQVSVTYCTAPLREAAPHAAVDVLLDDFEGKK